MIADDELRSQMTDATVRAGGMIQRLCCVRWGLEAIVVGGPPPPEVVDVFPGETTLDSPVERPRLFDKLQHALSDPRPVLLSDADTTVAVVHVKPGIALVAELAGRWAVGVAFQHLRRLAELLS
jgi:hypothetical protein